MSRHSHSVSKRLRTPALVAGLAAAALTASLAVAPAASAAILPTTTTVTASPATSVEGDAVTLTAAVYLKPVGGLIITPSGYVYFNALNGTQATQLGRSKLGRCFLTTCYASLTTTSIPAGSTFAQASYAGDLIANQSFGSTPITVSAPPPPVDDSTTITCAPNVQCDTATITSNDGLTQLQIDAPASPDGQTVTASLDSGGQLHCPGDVDPPTGGALATFDSTATTGEKVVHYIGHGSVGAQMFTNYANHTIFVGCFAMPTPFQGYTGGVYGPAQFVPADGLYEAQLSSCANNSGQRPCFVNIAGPGSDDEYEVHTLPGDPKIIG